MEENNKIWEKVLGVIKSSGVSVGNRMLKAGADSRKEQTRHTFESEADGTVCG